MSVSYKFLAHKLFQENINQFRNANPRSEKALLVVLERARSNPFSGKPLRTLPKDLQQKVFRLWIGGRSGFRLVYYVDREKGYIMGIYLSTVVRSKFDWEKSPWLKITWRILRDYSAGRYEKFAILDTETAAKSLTTKKGIKG